MGRVARLIMVTKENNNKFYDMEEGPDGSITSTWGRVDVTKTVTHYPAGKKKWDTLLKSKLKKGYVDHTGLRSVETTKSDFAIIGLPAIATIVRELQAFANKSVQQSYTISSEAVTPQMITAAQAIMNDLMPLLSVGKLVDPINDKLLELYKVIPRRMKKTQYHLLMEFDKLNKGNLADAERLVATEQATLDVMSGQVKVVAAQKQTGDTTASETILEAMGLDIVLPSSSDIQSIKRFLGRNASQYKNAFRVINKRTQAKSDKALESAANKTVQQYWHGSRNENWWSIIDSGLVLRPTNAVITGKMFGYGVYFADKAQKSIGYSSLRGSYWTGGSANRGFMSLFDVHLGNYLKIKRHQGWCYDLNKINLRKRGAFDSLFAEGGADLRNNEYIVYDDAQCTIKYLVEIG